MSNSLQEMKDLLRNLTSQRTTLSQKATREAEERFEKAGGCKCCQGKGTFTYRPTLDYMSEKYTLPCIYNPSSRNQDGSHNGSSFIINANSPYCTEETRASTKPLLRWTKEELETSSKLSEQIESLQVSILQEEESRKPRQDHMVRVVKGRKLPKGDYQCRKMGVGQYGPYCLVADKNNKTTFVSQENVIGLLECPCCKVYGTSDELAWSWSSSTCGPCRDKKIDSGEIS